MNYYVIWGGSWLNGPQYSQVASRNRESPDDRYFGLGFRLIKTLKL